MPQRTAARTPGVVPDRFGEAKHPNGERHGRVGCAITEAPVEGLAQRVEGAVEVVGA